MGPLPGNGPQRPAPVQVDVAAQGSPPGGDGPERDIIVIGGSAGSVEALCDVVTLLPERLAAAIFVVIHFPPTAESRLPQMLGRRGWLPVKHAVTGDHIQPGRILVAPPDHHMMLREDQVELSRGPRVNSARPAIDPLFYSAAEAFGPRVCGVVLSGSLDDGSNGLQAVAERGGVAIVQDPEQALSQEMPRNAIRRVPGALVMETQEIAMALSRHRLAGRHQGATGENSLGRRGEEASDLRVGDDHEGSPTGLTCPECHGALWATGTPGKPALECRIGHHFTLDALQQEQRASVERAMWAAVRSLREEATLARHLAARALANGRRQTAQRYEARQRQAENHADVLLSLVVEEPDPSRTDEPAAC